MKTVWLLMIGLDLLGCSRQTHDVVYEIEGSAGSVALTYRNGDRAVEQVDIQTPWRLAFEVESYERLMIHARTRNEGGTVSCKIWVDDELFASGESSGSFKAVRCEGLVLPPTPAPTPPSGA